MSSDNIILYAVLTPYHQHKLNFINVQIKK